MQHVREKYKAIYKRKKTVKMRTKTPIKNITHYKENSFVNFTAYYWELWTQHLPWYEFIKTSKSSPFRWINTVIILLYTLFRLQFCFEYVKWILTLCVRHIRSFFYFNSCFFLTYPGVIYEFFIYKNKLN